MLIFFLSKYILGIIAYIQLFVCCYESSNRLLEAMIEISLPELLKNDTKMSANEIVTRLALNPLRGWKFLHALALGGLLVEEGGSMGEDTAMFSLHSDVKLLYRDGSYFYKDYIAFQRYVDAISTKGSIVDVLRGATLDNTVQWPPQTPEAAIHLEHWMTVTSKGALNSLFASKALETAHRLLDVGGGDGTIALALTQQYNSVRTAEAPMHVTVFNLANSADLALKNIAQHSIAANRDCLTVTEGDFIKDAALPSGHDCIMFSRVLADWSPLNCVLILEKAKKALFENSASSSGRKGRIVISEPLLEGNRNLGLSWEYRYIFSDTFGKSCYKSVHTYVEILEKLGFTIACITPMSDDNFYTVIAADIDI